MKVATLGLTLALGGAAHAACTPDQTTRLLVERTAATHGLPPFLLTALVMRESGFCPNAVSHAGAIGYGQLMPATARSLGVNPYDPQQNLWGAAKYLRQQWDTFKDWRLALAAYNAGPGAVIRYGGIPPYQETQAYVRNVLGTYNQLAGLSRPATPVLAAVPARVQPRAAAQPVTAQPARPAQAAVPASAAAVPQAPSMARMGAPQPQPGAQPGMAVIRASSASQGRAGDWGEQAPTPASGMLVYRSSDIPQTREEAARPSPQLLANSQP